MRIIHTADWHLGKKLEHLERTAEHQLFLDWLLETIRQQQVEALVVAGDIFDTGSPSNEAQRMYFSFLRSLLQTTCRHVVVVGGNHDSASTLNAPQALLKAFDIHVVGGVPEEAADQIIPLTSKDGAVEAVVAAVPFLRDRDVRLSLPGESNTDREVRLRQGIIGHYTGLLPLLQPYTQKGIPVVATGHLYAAGATASESEKEIHVGTLGQVPGDLFPAAYDYVALGHLHRPQQLKGNTLIRYSGSPIPLSFSESTDQKSVVLLEATAGQPLSHTLIPIPAFRSLLRVQGNAAEAATALASIALPSHDPLEPWVEVQVHTEVLLANLSESLQEIAAKRGIGQLFTRQVKQRTVPGLENAATETLSLQDMDPLHVFDMRCSHITDEDQRNALMNTFKEALQLVAEW